MRSVQNYPVVDLIMRYRGLKPILIRPILPGSLHDSSSSCSLRVEKEPSDYVQRISPGCLRTVARASRTTFRSRSEEVFLAFLEPALQLFVMASWTTTQFPKPAAVLNDAMHKFLAGPPAHVRSDGICMVSVCDPTLVGALFSQISQYQKPILT